MTSEPAWPRAAPPRRAPALRTPSPAPSPLPCAPHLGQLALTTCNANTRYRKKYTGEDAPEEIVSHSVVRVPRTVGPNSSLSSKKGAPSKPARKSVSGQLAHPSVSSLCLAANAAAAQILCCGVGTPDPVEPCRRRQRRQHHQGANAGRQRPRRGLESRVTRSVFFSVFHGFLSLSLFILSLSAAACQLAGALGN